MRVQLLRLRDAADERLDAHGLFSAGACVLAQLLERGIGEFAVIVQRQIVLRQLRGHGVQLLLDGLADLGGIGGKVLHGVRRLPQKAVAQLKFSAFGIIILKTFAHIFAHFRHILALPDLFCKHIVQRIGRNGADFMDMAAELRVLARQLRRVILGRERDVNGHIVAGVFAQQLLFKAGDECAAAKHKRLLFRRTARKLFAVRKACIVEHQFVSVLRRTVENGRPTLALLLQPH